MICNSSRTKSSNYYKFFVIEWKTAAILNLGRHLGKINHFK